MNTESMQQIIIEDAISDAVTDVLRGLVQKIQMTEGITVREIRLMMISIIDSQKDMKEIRSVRILQASL